MGVQGLWELLSPVGRRVSVETLTGKKLAIDASIWMVQFMKAMRDEKGEMVRNAHLIGFFRRICKLMFLRTKPVFVFDGGTPALKRRTVIARRRQRENAQAKVRKTAEKLLLNHLKAMRLKELAEDLENQRKKNDAKGKTVTNDETEMARNNVEEKNNVPTNFNQEELDAMLAASLAAEENRDFAGNASTSGGGVSVDEEEGDEDEDEEMILPTMTGRIDPAVLASLPPSMQLDLLVQMRERLMAENRQKYQKVKKAPAKFSELQIQSYLKTVAFRREINQVQKSATGKDVGGVQTSRIASEANREFIFSSSFSGDKEALASVGVEGHSKNFPHKQPSEISSALLESISSSIKSNADSRSVADDRVSIPVEKIETFKDHRERFRASRRALGIQMTRDLQRNLDLIKEIEEDSTQTDEILNMATIIEKSNQFEETSHQPTDGSFHPVDPKYSNDEFKYRNEKLMEISFEDDGGDKRSNGDDEIFARLVAGDDTGDTTMISLVNSGSSKKHSFSSDSDCDWEGVSEDKVDSLTPAAEKENLTSHAEGGDDGSEVEWEDDDSYDPSCASLSATETRKVTSKGVLEEEADFQEALRRSLKDLSGNQSSDAPFDDKKLEATEMAHETVDAGSLHQENEISGFPGNPIEIDEFSNDVLTEVGRLEAEAIAKKTITDDLSGQLATSMTYSHDITGERIEDSKEMRLNYEAEPFDKDKSEGDILLEEIRLKESGYPGEEIAVPFMEQRAQKSETGKVPMSSNKFLAGGSQISDMVLGGTSDPILADAHPNISEAAANDSNTETTKQRETHMKESTTNHEVVQEFLKEKDLDNTSHMRGDEPEEFSFRDDLTNPSQFTKAGLEEEIQSLNQECIELGDQQRKLNRNMESVSSEMFAECQELLQMFGLPYIIAPMEAEAQCAYMELAGLVDGVVTDDSDAFLFGATSVYKNIFDDRKYVETYFMKDCILKNLVYAVCQDIENELGLSRNKLIRMALLLGSDYTEGVSGIGIVNAIEVVNAFPEEDGFRKFREWIESPDPNILGKIGAQTGSTSRKTGSRVSDSDMSCSNGNREGLSASESPATQNADYVDDTKQVFMDKHRNVSKNWHIPSNFPNEAVISAYASPEVDKSTELFSWGKPDHFVLRKLCWEKFGWNVQKADELLVPVLKEYNKRETQLRLEAFYTFNEKFAKIRSKRIEKAIKGIRGNVSSDLIDETVQETSKGRKKRRVNPDKSLDDVTQKPSGGTSKPVTEDESISAQRSTEKMSRKRKDGEAVPSEEKNKESVMQSRGRKTSKGSSGRGRIGNKRGRAAGRGQSRKYHDLDSTGSSDDGSNSDYEEEMQVEEVEGSLGARKSARTRKAVKYTLDELEIDEPSKEDQHEMNFDNSKGVEEQSPNDHDIAKIDTVTSVEKTGEPSLLENPNGDYLEVGGGFCMDEADLEFHSGHASSVPKDNSSFDEELSKEYLRVGGGFCLEEDDTNEEPVKGSLDEFRDEYAGDGQQSLDTSTSTPTVAVDCSTLAGSPHQGTKEADSHLVPTKSLCAMPALKRKRRKG